MTSRRRGVPCEVRGADGELLLATTTADLAAIEQTAATAPGPVTIRLPATGGDYTLTEFMTLPIVATAPLPKNGGSSVHKSERRR